MQKNTLRKFSLLFVIPFLILSSSCEMLSDELGECVNKISPKLPKKNMLQGKVGEPYSDIISAYVKNADEEIFEYAFSTEGNLPNGLNYRGTGRVFEIHGTALKSGFYTFKIKVELLNVINGVGDGFCFTKDADRQSYTIEIIE